MSTTTYETALEAAIDLALSPVLIRDPQTAQASAALLAVIDDGRTLLAPTGKRVKSPSYAVAEWIRHAIDVAQCAHSSRLVGILANDGGAL